MKKLLLAGIAMATLVTGVVSAAERPVIPPAYGPPPVAPPPPLLLPVYSWTGCFIGGNVGGVWVRKDFTASGLIGAPIGTALGSHDANSFLGGIQGGCNYQAAGWVFGAQADFDWANAQGTHPDPFFIGLNDRSRTRSLASVTGRVGYAWDRLLAYAKAGGAWERDEYIIQGPFRLATAAETRSGWTVGAGLEYGITYNLSGFVEYDYYGFGTVGVPFAFGTFPLGNVDIKENKHVVKAGLNWRFGTPPLVVGY
jgi:outer membrane immunogenic protein